MGSEDRINIRLIPRAAQDLNGLCKDTGMTKTDVVNRAVQLYAFVVRETGTSAAELALVNRETGELTKVTLF